VEVALSRRPLLTSLSALALATSTLVAAGAGPAGAAASPTGTAHSSARVCAVAPAGYAACASRVVTDPSGKPVTSATTPSGYGPSSIQSAYALTGKSGGGRTVAIVDAYDDPTAESDLSVYRAQFGLAACTTANGCFRKVNQSGGSTPPRTNGGWAQEISLDLDMVSATCPDCHILLVEASSASFANLGTAVNTAARLGASAISNSYGGSDASALSAYDHPGIAVTASTGDAGYGVESPASFGTVVAVGGTSLSQASTARGWSESAWSGAGSGCSTLNAKPSWQTSATSCSGKANADVSAVADPNTGVAVYDSTAYQGAKGWMVFGGTSVSSPIIASVYALSGNTAGYPASYTWAHASGLFDVTSGSNGSCPTSVWCKAGAGWDGPTGLGTPNGTTAF
jgi:subtilase family serine protease